MLEGHRGICNLGPSDEKLSTLCTARPRTRKRGDVWPEALGRRSSGVRGPRPCIRGLRKGWRGRESEDTRDEKGQK